MHDKKYKKAVILLNMGGPNSLNEVESFLKNMFADPCILSVKNGVMRGVIGSMIVNSRANKSKKIYEKLGGSSPLTPKTFSLTQKLQSRNSEVFYTYAMRYVPPFATDVLRDIMDKGIKEICLFSMYPQYSSTTTFSSFKDAADALKALKYTPKVQIIDRYSHHSGFINIIISEILRKMQGFKASEFILILSAHSIPLSRVKKGDPYQSECEKTRELIVTALRDKGVVFKDVILSYQSKVGPVKWLGPNTDSIIRANADSNIIVYPLSFTIDNSETLFELDMLYRDLHLEYETTHGKREFIVCQCPNDSDLFIEFIESLHVG
ncbi:ferrochelatase [Helicobacter saguini]|nr:ferrochelatase [Helicobacter saguini]